MRLLSLSERDGRLRFFLTNLAYSVLIFVPLEIFIQDKNFAAAIVISIPAMYLLISSAIRRCNDAGAPRRLLWFYPVPIIGMAIGLYLQFAPSDTGFSKKLLAYCTAGVACICAIGVIASFVLIKQSEPDFQPLPKAAQKSEIDFSYEQPASQPHPSVAFQQAEQAPVVLTTPAFDAARQAELARQADAERLRRNMESEKERERFYAKQYAERDVARCNLQMVMTDAEILACRDR